MKLTDFGHDCDTESCNKNQDNTSKGIDIDNMAREILAVISKRFPNENAVLQEVLCEGNLARCIYTINNEALFEVKL